MTVLPSFVVEMLLCSLVCRTGDAACAQSLTLPYDRTHSVIYDNDSAVESGYTDEYIMALAGLRFRRLS